MSTVLSMWELSPDMGQDLLAGADLVNSIADSLLRSSSATGDIYIDLGRLPDEGRQIAEMVTRNLPESSRPLLRQGQDGDADISFAEAARQMGAVGQPPRLDEVIGHSHTPSQLWSRMAARAGVPAPGLAPFISEMRSSLENVSASHPHGTSGAVDESAYWQRVTECFNRESLGWMIFWAMAAVLCIIGIILSGGTLAAVMGAVAWCLAGAGVMLGLSYVYQLVVCLIQSLSVPHYTS